VAASAVAVDLVVVLVSPAKAQSPWLLPASSAVVVPVVLVARGVAPAGRALRRDLRRPPQATHRVVFLRAHAVQAVAVADSAVVPSCRATTLRTSLAAMDSCTR